jgi:hypothetical protein
MDVLKIFARDTDVAERVAAASGVEAIVKAMKKWPKSTSVMKTVRALLQRRIVNAPSCFFLLWALDA